jgi:hypothetical protein
MRRPQIAAGPPCSQRAEVVLNPLVSVVPREENRVRRRVCCIFRWPFMVRSSRQSCHNMRGRPATIPIPSLSFGKERSDPESSSCGITRPPASHFASVESSDLLLPETPKTCRSNSRGPRDGQALSMLRRLLSLPALNSSSNGTQF